MYCTYIDIQKDVMQEKCEIMRYLAELFSGGGYGPINMTYSFL